MKPTTMQAALRAGVFMLPLGLAGCGGGSSPEYCAGNPGSSLCPADSGTSVAAPKSTTPSTAAPATVALFTSSPSAVSLNAGSSTTYTVGGGSPPYTATSANTSVARANVDGQTLSITSVSAGTTSVAIVDSVGKSIKIDVTTLAQGQAGAPLSITPGSLAVGDCTTNIPFVFSGGVAPFTIYSTDNVVAPVSAALPLGERSYFTTTLGPAVKKLIATNSNGVEIIEFRYEPRTFILTVLDIQSRTATATITVPDPHLTCPSNPLLQVSPASANFRVSEIQAFQIAGGSGANALPEISFSDNDLSRPIASVFARTNSSFSIQARNPGSTLMTVTSSDGQKTNIVVNVL